MIDPDKDDELPDDEIEQRMERSLKRAFAKPPEPHGKNPTTPRAPKAKTRPASRGRAHKGKV
jgi:hypothetical protein